MFKKFCKFYRKTSVLECLFNKFEGLRPSNVCRCPSKKDFLKILQNSKENTCLGVSFLKKRLQQVISCEIWKIFKNTYFEEHLRTTASVNYSCLESYLKICLISLKMEETTFNYKNVVKGLCCFLLL